ncbi:MAG: 2Fe-2S iron-sulfur cluster binding domain-containing protein [Gammaproteobacteria bacterium]|nr:2Fe-2S iron-sulfur cluster binding domain-containing protein [Gammaproteobacteria bacterium]
MKQITFKDTIYSLKEDESVLDALLRQGEDITFSCKKGICQTCLLRAESGVLDSASQRGLEIQLAEKNYFMPCMCHPETDLKIGETSPSDFIADAVIHDKQQISSDVYRILLEPATEVSYKAGQYINLYRPDGLARSYSLASTSQQDYFLELHVKRHEHGEMSRWLADDVQIGSTVEFSMPIGSCYYRVKDINQEIILIGTGTGLAPLLGIIREVLLSRHLGEVFLYHGVVSPDELYMDNTLLNLQQQYNNFKYIPCVITESESDTRYSSGYANSVAFSQQQDLTGCLLYLAGNPVMVSNSIQQAILAGILPENIHSDPFTSLKETSNDESSADLQDTEKQNRSQGETDYPEPLPEVWEALQKGDLLQKILDGFYDDVFEDELMAPYFANSTKKRAKEKVYSFYRRLFSGEKIYFGDRPRNSHHWMVITNELYDYRERLLEKHMRKQGLPEDAIRKWQAYEELYRGDIVKSKPRGRMVGNIEAPASGFGKLVMDVGGMCDNCHEEITIGTEVSYHLRTGDTYCPSCSSSQPE